MSTYKLLQRDDYWVGQFTAMASPCEILMDIDDPQLAQKLVDLAWQEAVRIEHKFSRYRDDNIIFKINHANGKAVEVDEETAAMLNYAGQCNELSEGKFDVTSGVLRKVWRFDGSDRLPGVDEIERLIQSIGWEKIDWQAPWIRVPPGMEIDLGGIGKEYAVDRTARLLRGLTAASLLVNFGGDLCVTGPRRNGQGWFVGVEDVATLSVNADKTSTMRSGKEYELLRGGIATSGDTRRYLLKDGVRYSHILDPKTGWPVPNAPRSVTVAAGSCTEAGMLATFAMLQGKHAEKYLKAQKVRFWCQR